MHTLGRSVLKMGTKGSCEVNQDAHYLLGTKYNEMNENLSMNSTGL